MSDTEKTLTQEERISPVESDAKVKEYLDKLAELRKDGSTKIAALKAEIYDMKRQKMIDEVSRNKVITRDQEALVEAKANKKEHSAEISAVVKEAVAYIKEISVPFEKEEAEKGRFLVEEDNPIHAQNLAALRQTYKTNYDAKVVENKERIAKFEAEKHTHEVDSDSIQKAQYKKDLANLKKECKDELESLTVSYNSQVRDENNRHGAIVAKKKQMIFDSYSARYDKLSIIKEGHLSPLDEFEHRRQNYVYNFNSRTFFLNNALYMIVGLFFIACFIISPIIGNGNILTWANISGFLEVASSRMFFALGVAGLIVLGGTDLSIGRLIGLGTVVVGFILHDGVVPAKLFDKSVNLNGMPFFGRVILALLLAIVATTLFTSIAGFFSAKFKMHPFITTLSTMMIVYGIGFVATSGVPTGTPDYGDIDSIILGRIGGSEGFPKYIIYAAIAIAIVWFIWNKTKFGKNMFAVGGNSEAAAVSGISYFKVTLGVFIMAGILYGFGTFFFAFNSNPATNTGYGYELDAIAACVVGGISFFGGIGKVKGAVIGCCIFAGLTYVLTLLGISSYWQFVVKGIILMSAVALDSLKYIKKK
jgi:methyl-galactoside transport system permease protein